MRVNRHHTRVSARYSIPAARDQPITAPREKVSRGSRCLTSSRRNELESPLHDALVAGWMAQTGREPKPLKSHRTGQALETGVGNATSGTAQPEPQVPFSSSTCFAP